MKYILINAASVTRHNPGKFWHPSRSILARLRRSTEVQLRIVAYDEKEGADLWDNEAISAKTGSSMSGKWGRRVNSFQIAERRDSFEGRM